jgi:cytoskeleton protein RodZ
MSSIGESLRRERRRRNLELDQVSQELRISTRFLEAIEDEQFEKLPAGVFAKSFVRQYARYLGLDEDELAAEVQRVLEPPAATEDVAAPRLAPIADIHVPRVDQWQTVSDGRRFDWSSWLPSLALVVVVMLVCSGVYSFWQRGRRQVSAQIPPPPVAVVPPADVPVPPAVAPAEPEATPPAEAQRPESAPPESHPPESAPPKAAPPKAVAQAPAVSSPPVATPARRTESADRAPDTSKQDAPRASKSNAAVRIELTADEPVWVLARAGGKYLFSGTLEPKQTRSVESNSPLLLRLGNAGGVNITLNGKPLGPVGPKGQVRDVEFTSGGFHVVAATKASPDNPI